MDVYVESEWELVDNNGFIYKRRKKTTVPPCTTPPVRGSQEPILSEQAERKAREASERRKKRTVLLAQKERYDAEIREWEILLSRPAKTLGPALIPESPISDPANSTGRLHRVEDIQLREELQTLNIQVEAYERFIEQLKTLVDQADRLSEELEMNVEVDRVRHEQDLLKEEEIIKRTPRTLLSALTSRTEVMLPVLALPLKSDLGRLLAE